MKQNVSLKKSACAQNTGPPNWPQAYAELCGPTRIVPSSVLHLNLALFTGPIRTCCFQSFICMWWENQWEDTAQEPSFTSCQKSSEVFLRSLNMWPTTKRVFDRRNNQVAYLHEAEANHGMWMQNPFPHYVQGHCEPFHGPAVSLQSSPHFLTFSKCTLSLPFLCVLSSSLLRTPWTWKESPGPWVGGKLDGPPQGCCYALGPFSLQSHKLSNPPFKGNSGLQVLTCCNTQYKIHSPSLYVSSEDFRVSQHVLLT